LAGASPRPHGSSERRAVKRARTAGGRRSRAEPGPPPEARRPLLVALFFVGLALALTAEERAFGLFTDRRTMTRTAFAIADLHELGIARSNRIEIRRKEGDAVTRYGVGPSLARALPMLVAEPVDRSVGLGASQTLFVAEQIGFLLAAAL